MLRTKDAIDAHEEEHGKEEHAEGNEALLALLELRGTDTQAFDDAVEELAGRVNHHLTEEELTILNPARQEVSDKVKADLGRATGQLPTKHGFGKAKFFPINGPNRESW